MMKLMPSIPTNPPIPSAAAALRSTVTPVVVAPIWMTSLPAPPSYRSAAETWFVALTTKRSAWLLPMRISSPAAALIEIVSVPDVQVAKVQPERSTDAPAFVLMIRAWVDDVPVIATVVEILPAANWAALNVAVDVPEVLTKVIASKSTKPAMSSVAPALRSTATPTPAVPIWITSTPGLPPALNVSVALTVPVATT